MPRSSKSSDQYHFSQDAIVIHRQAIGSLLHFMNTPENLQFGAGHLLDLETDADVRVLLRASTTLINDLSALRRDACRIGVASGLSIREMARQMGVSHSTVRIWLNIEESAP